MKLNLYEQYHLQLLKRLRAWLNARGIIDEVINHNFIGWNGNAITIPIFDREGNFSFFKFRKSPEDANEEKPKYWYTSGATVELYGWRNIRDGRSPLIICEGELDCLTLESRGFAAITSTGGALTFKKGWAALIPEDVQVYICLDNDEAGRNGTKKIAELLSDAKIIFLPSEVGEHGDITDFFIKLGKTSDDFRGLLQIGKTLNDIKEQIGIPTVGKLQSGETERIKRIDMPEREMSFNEWQETIKTNFPELLFPAEIGLSIVSQLLIKEITNPFALVLVDVPSAGKTITINFFSEIDGLTYATDKFTPASFVSHASNVKKADLPKIDLLPRLRYKMFLIRDLSTIFSKREEDLNECLGTLTRVLDGEGLNADTGVHGQRHYTGEYLFMILAGSTPIPPKVWKMMGNLGSRLFFLNMGVKEKSEEELAEQITTLAYKEKEKSCRLTTKHFLQTLWQKNQNGIEWNKSKDKQEDKIIIARCARLLAKLRGVINLWKDKSQDGEVYDYTYPVIEKPDRINQLFYNLCRGHAVVRGRAQISREDLKLIVELAIDSSPTIRAKLFRKLLENCGVMKTNEVEVALQCSKPTALKEMETLKILGVCYQTQDSDGEVGGQEKMIHLSEDFKWFLTDECRAIRGLPLIPKQRIVEQNTLADLL